MFLDGVKKTISSTSRAIARLSSDRSGSGSGAQKAAGRFSRTQPMLTWQRLRECASQRTQYKRRQHWFPSLPFQQFQVLFNSLFKVLCIFPSRYLFAIGLPPIFSFRWNLPPALSCSPKQLDSLTRHVKVKEAGMNGSLTLSAALFQGTYPASRSNAKSTDHNSYI